MCKCEEGACVSVRRSTCKCEEGACVMDVHMHQKFNLLISEKSSLSLLRKEGEKSQYYLSLDFFFHWAPHTPHPSEGVYAR